MPDLLTHAIVNLALPVGTLRPAHLGWFVVGGALPDLASRGPALALSRGLQPLLQDSGLDLDWLIMGMSFLHLPLGVATLSLLAGAALPGWLLRDVARWALVRLLLGGACVHLLLDVMQHHLRPGYRYLFPFSMRPCELGWFSAEASLTWWPWLLPLTAVSLGIGRWRRSRRAEARPGV